MSTLLHGFIESNRRACVRISRHLPQAQVRIFATYDETVLRYANRQPNQNIVDVGGGARCEFARNSPPSSRIIAADISPSELMCNHDSVYRVACDASQSMPFADGSVDMVVSRSVIEHMADVDGFLTETWRVLKPGGISIHLFPSKHAPFSVINRLLPHRLSRALLYRLQPSQKGVGGFRAHYQKCSPVAFQRLLRKKGFDTNRTLLSYFQSDYFNFFVPFFLVSCTYEIVVRALGLRSLCAFVLSVGVKPSATAMSAETCAMHVNTEDTIAAVV